jgi:hypothetical protein
VSALEQQARAAWHAWGGYVKHTFCAGCLRQRYCRARRQRGPYLCVDCWDTSSEGQPL